jgi:hypothetical protein
MSIVPHAKHTRVLIGAKMGSRMCAFAPRAAGGHLRSIPSKSPKPTVSRIAGLEVINASANTRWRSSAHGGRRSRTSGATGCSGGLVSDSAAGDAIGTHRPASGRRGGATLVFLKVPI